MKPPVVVIPGVTATSLKDFYPPEPEGVWGQISKDLLRVALHPDDLRLEQIEPALLRPGEALSIPYDHFARELRHDLSPSRDELRPVFLFGHDWRQPLAHLVDQLGEFIEEVVARTALLRHYARSDPPFTRETGRVDLVGHSMGGLVAAGYLVSQPDHRRVRKVITLGTPYRGSFEAVLKIITGTSGLDSGVPKSSEREVARVTPSLYHLLPDGGLTVEEGPSELPDSLFCADLWQRGVLETLAEHIRQKGLEPERSRRGRLEQARALLQGMLDEARGFREEVGTLSLADRGLSENDWMAVVGIGEETRVALRIRDQGKKAGSYFDLTSLHRRNGYPMPPTKDGEVVAALEETGDGTVPYWGAVPPFLDERALVCVSPDDFGYWEIRDRFLAHHIANLHGMLPAMNQVIKLSAAFLDSEAGEPARGHPGIRARRSPVALRKGREWTPPFRDLREKVPEGFGGVV